MAINYTFSIEDKTLKVVATGKDDNLQEVKNYSQAVIDEAIKNECDFVFCDERNLEYSLSMIDTYRLAEEASKKVKRTARIAIVCNEKYIEDGKFYETVVSNRGLRVVVTSNYDMAISWLKSM